MNKNVVQGGKRFVSLITPNIIKVVWDIQRY